MLRPDGASHSKPQLDVTAYRELVKPRLLELERYGHCGPALQYDSAYYAGVEPAVRYQSTTDIFSTGERFQEKHATLYLERTPFLILDHDGLAANTEKVIVQAILIGLEVLLSKDRNEDFRFNQAQLDTLKLKFFEQGELGQGILGQGDSKMAACALERIREWNLVQGELRTIDVDSFIKLYKEVRADISDIFLEQKRVELIPGFAEFAATCVNAGATIFWLTGNFEKFMRGMDQIYLDQVGPVAAAFTGPESRYCTGDMDPSLSKPNPTLLNRIMQQLKAKPEQCLYWGDRVTDLMTAARAGISAVYLPENRDDASYQDASNPHGKASIAAYLETVGHHPKLAVQTVPGFEAIRIVGKNGELLKEPGQPAFSWDRTILPGRPSDWWEN